MGAFVALREEMVGYPPLEKDLELMEESGSAGGGIVADLVELTREG